METAQDALFHIEQKGSLCPANADGSACNNMKRYLTSSPQETESLAQSLAELLRPGDVIAFRGGMGAGKTAFVRGLARGLDCPGQVSSPTFSLVHEYGGRIPLCHFDMYRISTLEDLCSTGYFDYLEAGCILAVEGSEHIQDALENPLCITIQQPEGPGSSQREITIEGGGRF